MTATATFVTPAGPGHRVPLGHAADTSEHLDYVAHTDYRVCNGLITGDVGIGKTTLVDRIGDFLDATGRWTVRRVDADWRDAPAQALLALDEAERVISHRRDRDPLHLVIWDGLDQLVADRRLGHRFAARVAAVADHGPEYGIAQLATAQTRVIGHRADTAAVHILFADNVIALHSGSRDDWLTYGGSSVRPSSLPRAHGHAYALQPTVGGRAFVHVHLDGAQVHDCSVCCGRAMYDALTATPQVPLADADDVFAYHAGLRLIARSGDRGRTWRWLGVRPGDEVPTPRQVQELRPVPQGVNR